MPTLACSESRPSKAGPRKKRAPISKRASAPVKRPAELRLLQGRQDAMLAALDRHHVDSKLRGDPITWLMSVEPESRHGGGYRGHALPRISLGPQRGPWGRRCGPHIGTRDACGSPMPGRVIRHPWRLIRA